ncbi:MAG TPA: GGDEF domain-containing protein [Longimicrobiales bacterium]
MLNATPFIVLALAVVAALFGWTGSPVTMLFALAAAAWAGHALRGRRGPSPASVDAPPPAPTPLSPPVREQDVRRELEHALAVIRNAAGAGSAMLWQLDRDHAVARAVAATDRPLPQPRALRGDPLDWVAREGTPMRIEPAPSWVRDGMVLVAARLWPAEDRGWIVTLEMPVAATASPDILDDIAAPLRLLVQLQESRHESDAERRRMATVVDILRRMPSDIEPEKFGRDLLEACMRLAQGTGGVLGQWEGNAGRIVAVAGSDGGPVIGEMFESPESELALAVLATGTLVRQPGAWKPGPTQIGNDRDAWRERPRTFAALPLQVPTGIIGVIAVWSTYDQALNPEGIELIAAIAPYAALHLDHAAQFGRMRETAESDGLTGLRNRRAFDSALQQESLRVGRTGRPLSLLMIDIDHFKSVNDRFGHEAGDEVLRRVADILRHCVREVDVAARFGGEEMAVLLPETPIRLAREIAERIRSSIEAAILRSNGQEIPVTVSIGVAAMPETVAVGSELVGSADAALYTAKREGRNRVVG